MLSRNTYQSSHAEDGLGHCIVSAIGNAHDAYGILTRGSVHSLPCLRERFREGRPLDERGDSRVGDLTAEGLIDTSSAVCGSANYRATNLSYMKIHFNHKNGELILRTKYWTIPGVLRLRQRPSASWDSGELHIRSSIKLPK